MKKLIIGLRQIKEEKLAETDFYTKSPAEFEKTAKELEQLKSLLDEKETRWLELNILAEETAKD